MGAMGGAEANVLASARGLQERGHHNFLVYRHATGREMASWEAVFESREIVTDAASVVGRVASLRVDVIWVHNWESFEDIAGLARSGRPVARMVHDHGMYCLRTYKYHPLTRRNCERPASLACIFPCLAIVQRGEGRLPVVEPGSLGRKFREIAANRELSRVVVASGYMREELLRNRFGDEQVVVLPPVPPEREGVTDQADEAATGVHPEPGRLLFAGQLIRGKGLDVLLRAAAELRGDWHLDAAGEGNGKEKLVAQAEALGIANRVSFHGHLPAADLAALYRRARVVVFPSMWPEPFGLVGIEAMRFACPVVAFDVGGVSDWLKDGINGRLVPWGDASAMTRAIQALIEDPEEAGRLGENGRLMSGKAFSFATYLSNLEAFLAELANHPNPISPDHA